jgi:hypothetical protein
MVRGLRILIILSLSAPGTNLFSQELSHQVLVPVAGVISTGTINYSQTIGETAVEIMEGPEHILTQGFQQPLMRFPTNPNVLSNGVDVYPNPATDNVTVKLYGLSSRDFRIELINITGTVVYTEKLSFSGNYYLEKHLQVENYYKGIYFIRVISSDKTINRIFKIEKL